MVGHHCSTVEVDGSGREVLPQRVLEFCREIGAALFLHTGAKFQEVAAVHLQDNLLFGAMVPVVVSPVSVAERDAPNIVWREPAGPSDWSDSGKDAAFVGIDADVGATSESHEKRSD